MASDRIIKFPKNPAPDVTTLKEVLEDYFGDAASVAMQSEQFLLVSLPGRSSFPLARHPELAPSETYFNGMMELASMSSDRFIEVHLTESSLNFLTRCGDDLTNGSAKALESFCAQLWEGVPELDSHHRDTE